MNSIYEFIDRIWHWISQTVFVRFEFDLPAAQLKASAESGPVVFTLTHAGILEWLILSSWCRKEGLGAILVANRKRVLLFAKPKYFFQVLFGRRTYAELFMSEAEKGPRLLFCPVSERKKPFVPTPFERVLGEIYSRAEAAGTLASFTLVPVFILWRKHVRGSRRLSEYLLGLSSRPNFIGKIWYLIRRREDSTVRALGTLPLAETEGTEGLIDEPKALRAAKATRRRILVLKHQEMRVVLGPRYHSPHSVKETLLRDPEIQSCVNEIAKEEGVEPRKVLTRAYRNLTELVSNYRYRLVEVLYVVLTWLFNKVFEGVVVKPEEMGTVREILKNRPVVFVPCHRSHLDYLVIPYLLFEHDIVTPHIAAGINLAFWPVGYLLRLGGAFFIRRSFRGDPLYALCVKKYVEYLIKNRYNIMFFIEGTRSRSGKMLAPAYGMLKMTLETCSKNICEDIAIVPVSICYDEVPEQGAYSKELAGEQKVPESARELIKSRRLVRRKIGKVYVRMAEAVSAREVIKTAAGAGIDETLMLQKTAFQLCKSINDVTPVTAKSVVSAVFLAHIEPALPLEDILRLSEMMAHYVRWTGLPLAADGELDATMRRSAEQTLRALQKAGTVSVSESVPRGFFCENRRRSLLNFYKNNAIHGLVSGAILLVSFMDRLDAAKKKGNQGFAEDWFQDALKLRNVLKFEFFFSPTPAFVEELKRNVGFFFGERATENDPPETLVNALGDSFENWSDVSIFTRLLGDLLESYLTVVNFVLESKVPALDKKAFLQRVGKFAEVKQMLGGIIFPESISVQNYTNALSLLQNVGVVEAAKQGDKTVYTLHPEHEALQELRSDLTRWLELMQEKPENIVHPESRLVLT